MAHGEEGPEDPPKNDVEDDRGLIAALSRKNIIEMLEGTNHISKEGRKMSLCSETDQGKASFGIKTMNIHGDQLDPVACGLGYTCRKGLKPESPNQDSWSILRLETISLYAVFDGHGKFGHDVSNFVKDNLPKLIIRDPRFGTEDMCEMLADSFRKMQSLIGTMDRTKKLSAQLSGTTATVVLHDHLNKKLYTAHVADSTAAIGNSNTARALTRDHKPNLPDERARIEEAGGKVQHDGCTNHRVYAKTGRYPGLNMSRCLGDLMGHANCGITCEPEVSEVDITPQDSILLVCSDGVWEFISPQTAMQMVTKFPPGEAMVAAELLAKEAWDNWIREENWAVVDDITVLVVHLNNRASEI